MSTARALKLDLARGTRAWAPARSRMNTWAAAALGKQGEGREIAVRIVAERESRALNKMWRGKDKPTNVLSFPAQTTLGAAAPHLGDIVIAFEITALEAEREGKPFAHHLTHLAVHGYLHLLGHDHETDREAEAMERLETKILARIGIPDPYERAPKELAGHEAATLKSHA